LFSAPLENKVVYKNLREFWYKLQEW